VQVLHRRGIWGKGAGRREFQLGLPIGDLAVRYFYVGLIVIFMRGIVTETISRILFARRAAADEEKARDAEEPEVATTAGERPAPEGA